MRKKRNILTQSKVNSTSLSEKKLTKYGITELIFKKNGTNNEKELKRKKQRRVCTQPFT